MRITKHKKNNTFALLVFSTVYVLFSLSDFMTSIQTGFYYVDRSKTHIYIILVTVVLFLYFLFEVRKIILTPVLSGLILLGIWTIVVNYCAGVDRWTFLLQSNFSVMWVLVYLFFEDIRYREQYNDRGLRFFVVVFFLFYAVATVYYFFDTVRRLNHFQVLNMSYYLLALIPWIIHSVPIKKQKWVLVVCIAVSILSMKRGAIIAVVLMIITDNIVKKGRITVKTMLRWIGVALVFIILFLIVDKQTNGYLAARFRRESLLDGSGRYEQYLMVWNQLKTRGIVPLVFGVGCAKSITILGTGIHNEWLTFLFNYGLIGLGLYIFLIVGMLQNARKIGKFSPKLKSSVYMMFVFYLVLSMISTGYGGYIGLLLFGFWGYINSENRIQIEGKADESL